MKRQFKEGKMLEAMSGTNFRESGALWYANKELHKIGMALIWDSETDEIKPSFCKFRGFDEKTNKKCQADLDRYLEDHKYALKFEEEN
jgi:hypothetical protein